MQTLSLIDITAQKLLEIIPLECLKNIYDQFISKYTVYGLLVNHSDKENVSKISYEGFYSTWEGANDRQTKIESDELSCCITEHILSPKSL